MRDHTIAQHALAMKFNGAAHVASGTVTLWRAGLGANCRALHVCTIARPEDPQALYEAILVIIEGSGAVVAPIMLDHTAIDHKLNQGPVIEGSSTGTGGGCPDPQHIVYRASMCVDERRRRLPDEH